MMIPKYFGFFQVGVQHDGVLRPVRVALAHRLHRLRIHLPQAKSSAPKPARFEQQVHTYLCTYCM